MILPSYSDWKGGRLDGSRFWVSRYMTDMKNPRDSRVRKLAGWVPLSHNLSVFIGLYNLDDNKWLHECVSNVLRTVCTTWVPSREVLVEKKKWQYIISFPEQSTLMDAYQINSNTPKLQPQKRDKQTKVLTIPVYLTAKPTILRVWKPKKSRLT